MTDPVIAHDFRLAGVVTLVDAVTGINTLDAQPEAVKQAAVADLLVITKTDLAAPTALAELRQRLHALNPGAERHEIVAGALDPAVLLATGPYDPARRGADVLRWLAAEAHAATGHDHHHHHHHDPNRHDARIRAFCLRREAPVAAAALELFLDLLTAQRGPDLLRLKGIVAVAEDPDRPLVLHGVQHLLHEPLTLDAWPSADRATRLVLITRDLPAEPIERLLTALGSVEAATAPPDPR